MGSYPELQILGAALAFAEIGGVEIFGRLLASIGCDSETMKGLLIALLTTIPCGIEIPEVVSCGRDPKIGSFLGTIIGGRKRGAT
jgi:hypothetical protein